MVDSTYQVFVDLDATALEGGYVYVGVAYGNPETTPVALFWDEALTIPAAQPLRTSGGYIVRNGTPSNVYGAEALYSVRVRNSQGRMVYYAASTGGDVPASKRKFPIAAGAEGEQGPTGPANSTFMTLAELKAAPQTNTSFTLATSEGRAEYSFMLGDFTGEADDIATIKLDAVPITQGALVRAGFTVVDVTDVGFGAKGNFVQDDTAAIQRAIDYVWRRGGGDVRFPPGVYKISLSNPAGMFQLVGLVQRGGVNLVGQGRTRSIIKLRNNDPSTGPGAAIRIIGTPPGLHNGLGCYNLGVDGNYQNQPNIANSPGNGGNIVYGLFEGIPSNVVIDNCASYNAYGQGIMVTGYSDFVNGTYPSLAFNVRVTNNDVYDCSFIGIQVSQFKSLHIVNNKVARTADNAIDIYGFNNNFSAPGVSSSRFTVTFNHVDGAGGAGVFPETVGDGIVAHNIFEGCINGIQANCIAGTMEGVIITSNHSINCQNGYAHTGAHATQWTNNYARGFTYGGFVLGVVGGEASYAKYDNFRFKPASATVPLVIVPDGVLAANFNDPGPRHWITQADTNNPTIPARWFFSTTAALIRSPRPVFASLTEDTPSDRSSNPIIEGRVQWTAQLPVYADNAAAVAAIGPDRDYKRDADGPTYRSHS
jgi:hypothetical protein